MTIELRKKIIAVGVILLPIFMVQLTAALLSEPGPADASAAVPKPVTNPAGILVKLPQSDAGSIAAARHIAELHSKDFGQPPLHYLVKKGDGPIVDYSAPQLVIQMIMVTSRGNVALIDGEKYRVGDKLGKTNWAVKAIDGQKQTVTIVDLNNGRQVTRGVN